MRHRIYGKHLGRDKDQRHNLFKGLVQALLTHGTIQLSLAKAKAIKGLVDQVINLAKDKRTQGRLQSFITDKNLQERLIKEIVPKLADRTSGYTSMVRVGTRLGDQTMMVKMSLIGAEELKPLEKVTSNKVPASRGEQVTRKTEEKVKKPTIRKATPAKKVTQKKTTSRRRTAK